MSQIPPFTGFPSEALQFFAELAVNNNRDWFVPRKAHYQEVVLAPAQAFVVALGQRLQKLSPDIGFNPRTSGSGSIKRIYRDIRFSKDKTPYKTHLGIHFWQGNKTKKMENPGYFFHMGLEGSWVYGGHYRFAKPLLTAYRRAVADDTLGPELEAILADILAHEGFETGGQHYKRVPAGFPADHPRTELLKHNGLWAASEWIPEETLESPKLVEVCASHVETMLPLVRWIKKVEARAEG